MKPLLAFVFVAALSAPMTAPAQDRGPGWDRGRSLPATTPQERFPAAWDLHRAGGSLNTAGLTLVKRVTFAPGCANIGLFRGAGRHDLYVETILDKNSRAPGGVQLTSDAYDCNGGALNITVSSVLKNTPVGAATSVTGDGSTATITFAAPPAVASGQRVHVSGLSPDAMNGDVFVKVSGDTITYRYAGPPYRSGAPTVLPYQWQGANFYSISRQGQIGDAGQYGLWTQTFVWPTPGPNQPCPWTSAWWLNRDFANPANTSYVEIDGIETCVHSADFHDQAINLHNWPGSGPPGTPPAKDRRLLYNFTQHMMDGRPHTIALFRTPTKSVVYWDGVEVVRLPVNGADWLAPLWENAVQGDIFYDPGPRTSPYTFSIRSMSHYSCAAAVCDSLNP